VSTLSSCATRTIENTDACVFEESRKKPATSKATAHTCLRVNIITAGRSQAVVLAKYTSELPVAGFGSFFDQGHTVRRT
jgi:hypothetical protein